MKDKGTFLVIEGGKEENERLFRELLEAPHRFTLDEYEALVERFRDWLTFEQIMALFIRRLEKRRCKDKLEQRMLLAIIRGDYPALDRLTAIHEGREARGLAVVDGEPGKENDP